MNITVKTTVLTFSKNIKNMPAINRRDTINLY